MGGTRFGFALSFLCVGTLTGALRLFSGASCGSMPSAAKAALVATSVIRPRLSSCRQTVSSRLARASLIKPLLSRLLRTLPAALPLSLEAGFDGGAELRQSWRDGLTPDPLLTVSQWAYIHRYLSPRASAEPGRYRTDRTPYMRAIMDALSPSHPSYS